MYFPAAQGRGLRGASRDSEHNLAHVGVRLHVLMGSLCLLEPVEGTVDQVLKPAGSARQLWQHLAREPADEVRLERDLLTARMGQGQGVGLGLGLGGLGWGRVKG